MKKSALMLKVSDECAICKCHQEDEERKLLKEINDSFLNIGHKKHTLLNIAVRHIKLKIQMV